MKGTSQLKKNPGAFTTTTWLFLLATPLAVASLFLWWHGNATLADLSPVWTDELYYWHQAKTFSVAGFRGGYYTFAEMTPTAPFAHFYAWGIVIPALYGSIASIFGWLPMAIPLTNLLLMSGGLLVYSIIVRPRMWQSLALIVAIATFPGFLLRYFSSMIALLELALALVVGAGFVQLLKSPTVRHSESLWLVPAIIFASTIRLTWVLLLIPCAVLFTRERRRRAVITGICAGILGVGLMAVWHRYTAAPYPYALWGVLDTFDQGWMAGLSAFLHYGVSNVTCLFKGHSVELWTRAHIVVLLLVTTGWAAVRSVQKHPRQTWVWEALFHGLNLGSLVVVVLLYDVFDWRDFRFFHPRIFLSLVVFIGMNHRRLTILAILPLLMVLPATLRQHDVFLDEHLSTENQSIYAQWQDELDFVLMHDTTAANGWCNSLYHTWYYFIHEVPLLMAVDGGIGLSFAPPFGDHAPPYKSKYLLLDNAYYAKYKDRLNVSHLRCMPNGALYKNLDSSCSE